MSSQMPTDQRLARVLRAYVPDRATPGLDGRIMASVATTPQRRRILHILGFAGSLLAHVRQGRA